VLTLFACAFGLGLLFNAAPGAVFAETVRQGLRGGFRPALAVQVGSLAGDASWAILGLLGAGLLARLEALSVPLGVASAGYLAWLSWDSWRAARQHREFGAQAPGTQTRHALRAGVLLSLSNPQNIAYWAALGSALAAFGVAQPQPADYGVFFAGFMTASIAWCFICAVAVGRLQHLAPGWARLTYRLCAVLLLALALGTLRDLIERSRGATPARPAPALAAPLS
jgi:chemosensory pili system protein ChpE